MLPSLRVQTKSCGFTTDIPYLTNWGQPLLLGPGSILVAHTRDEFVLRKGFGRGIGPYSLLVRRLLASGALA